MYGGFYEIHEIIQSLPQVQKRLNTDESEEPELQELRVNEWFAKNDPADKKFRFRTKINRKYETINLCLNIIAGVDGDFKYYFGLELGHCELKEPFRYRELASISNSQLKAVNKVFAKYCLGNPKLFLIQAMA